MQKFRACGAQKFDLFNNKMPQFMGFQYVITVFQIPYRDNLKKKKEKNNRLNSRFCKLIDKN